MQRWADRICSCDNLYAAPNLVSWTVRLLGEAAGHLYHALVPSVGQLIASAGALQVGVWREYKLQEIVEKLDGMNYVCYMDGEFC